MKYEWSQRELERIKAHFQITKEILPFDSAYDWLQQPDYHVMVFSFKSITLDVWIEKDKLKRLFEGL